MCTAISSVAIPVVVVVEALGRRLLARAAFWLLLGRNKSEGLACRWIEVVMNLRKHQIIAAEQCTCWLYYSSLQQNG